MLLILSSAAFGQMRSVPQPGKSPLVTFRIVFTTGSAADPAEKPGLAAFTAMMIADSGTKELTYKQIADLLFPMAANFNVQTDKEMTTFSGTTHIDNLTEYYKIMRARLLDPGWRKEDFERIKDDALNSVREGLRNNDEELAKEVLYSDIYQGTPYGHFNLGTVSSLEKITLEDVQKFYRAQYTQSTVILGIGGGYPANFLETMKKDFKALPVSAGFRPRVKLPENIPGNRAIIVEKDTRSVAFSIGFPIVTSRNTVDYPAMLLAATYLGQHRMSGGVLYNEMRERRGLNYGDYAYIEYFPQGMFLMEPPQNLARRQQIFQMWIRPVEPATAKFALRLALYELDQLVKNGISEGDFERTKEFLSKYVNVLTRTRRAQLGYAIDSIWYGMPVYDEYLKGALAKLTLEDVNGALKHLRTNRLVIVAVSKNAEELKRQLASDDPSPMTYNSPKPEAVTAVDKVVEKWPLHLVPDAIRVVPVGEVFQ